MQPLKERLVARRNALGWSQETLAEKSTVSARSIAAYESGEGKPSHRILEKLADAMQVSTVWLMGGDDNTNPKPESGNRELTLDDWKQRAIIAEHRLEQLRNNVRAASDLSEAPLSSAAIEKAHQFALEVVKRSKRGNQSGGGGQNSRAA